MRKHLNTLFITTEGAYLRKSGEAVEVRFEKQTRLRVPLHNLDGVVCFGRVGCSPMLMAACAKANVSISFLTPYGGFLAAVTGFTPGNVVLRREQYRRADHPSNPDDADRFLATELKRVQSLAWASTTANSVLRSRSKRS